MQVGRQRTRRAVNAAGDVGAVVFGGDVFRFPRRYHVRSGNSTHATTRFELFGNERCLPSIIAANPNFYGVFECLPNGFLDKRKVIDEHTLVPYLLRFSNNRRRTDTYACLLGDISKAPNTVNSLRQWPTGEKMYLRYCPLCVEEDNKKYGELYWHRSHQITLLPICPTHRCLLENSTIQRCKSTGEHFAPALPHYCPPTVPKPPTQAWQLHLSDTLVQLLESPLSMEDNRKEYARILYNKLQDAGIYSTTSGKVAPYDLLKELIEFYGAELCDVYFPADSISANAHRITRTGTFSFSEQYVLIAVMLGLPPNALTMGWVGEDDIAKQMRKMARSGYLWKKQAVAERLGVKSSQLSATARQRGITPFWLFGDGRNSLRQDDQSLVCVKTMMTRDMKESVDARIEELGIANPAEYIRYCIRKDLSS